MKREKGIGLVSRKWMQGAEWCHRLVKQMDHDVSLREAAALDREYRYGRYKNPALPVLKRLQKCKDPEVLAGFAAVISDLFAVQLDGNSHDAEYVRKLLKTAMIS